MHARVLEFDTFRRRLMWLVLDSSIEGLRGPQSMLRDNRVASEACVVCIAVPV